MRRSDREIKRSEIIDSIIESCDCCRLGFIDGDSTYILPLNFGFENNGEKRIFYFHGASEGKKIDLIRACPKVGFEMDTKHRVNASDADCECSFSFQSVMGKGCVSFVDTMEEKVMALEHIMRHYSTKEHFSFSENMLNITAVFKLEVEEISCKEHL